MINIHALTYLKTIFYVCVVICEKKFNKFISLSAEKISDLPDLNQGPFDYYKLYSQTLYQLS